MSEYNKEKFYWLKLKRDFFKRHDIQIVENMPNGKDYILFYLKLLCESVDHNGCLRFNDEIPYNEAMLSTITNTNIDIVRSAISVFASLKMIEVYDDGTYYMKEVEKMIGCQSISAEKKQIQRQLKKEIGGQMSTLCPPEIEIEKEKEIEKKEEKKNNIKRKDEKKKERKSRVFVKPTVEEVRAYCEERNNGIDAEAFVDFYISKGWMVGKNPMKDWQAAVRTWEQKRKKDEQQSKANSRKPTINQEVSQTDLDYYNSRFNFDNYK